MKITFKILFLHKKERNGKQEKIASFWYNAQQFNR